MMLTTIRHLLEMIRFSHTLFALPFALLAAVMAWHVNAQWIRLYNWSLEAAENMRRATPMLQHDGPGHELIQLGNGVEKPIPLIRISEVVALLLCMAAARSFAMSINRLADRHLDAVNPRTAGRHLPAGILSVGQVAAFSAASAVVFVVSTLLFLPNWLPLALSAPVLLYLAGYSFAKRYTWLAHIWLGTALGFAPIAAWIAIRGFAMFRNPIEFLPPTILGAAVLTWVAGFDILYACQDYDADRRAKLHSIPVKFGVCGALRIAGACHGVTVLLLAALAVIFPFGWIFWTGVAAVAVLLIYEHLLVRPDDLSHVNAAFFNVNAVISLGLFAVGTIDLLMGHG